MSSSFVLTEVIILLLQGYQSFSPWKQPLILFSKKEVDFFSLSLLYLVNLYKSVHLLISFWSMCAASKTVPKRMSFDMFRFCFVFIVFQMNRNVIHDEISFISIPIHLSGCCMDNKLLWQFINYFKIGSYFFRICTVL